jgi:chromate reductase, NAD(P)H dehydrogenase (quinone)
MSLAVLGIAGSLRAASYNRALLRAAQELAPEGMAIRIFELAAIPSYDGDLEARGDPASVVELKQSIRDADALLIATPEYNYGIPGVLKNAIDWASRPPTGSVLVGKRTALMGGSRGSGATIRSQMQLRQVLLATETPVLLRPEVLFPRIHEKVDAGGRLVDERTRSLVKQLLQALQEWTRGTERLGATTSNRARQ